MNINHNQIFQDPNIEKRGFPIALNIKTKKDVLEYIKNGKLRYLNAEVGINCNPELLEAYEKYINNLSQKQDEYNK